MAKKGDYKIPFDKQGNQLHYPAGVGAWRQNCTFDAILQIDDKLQRGMSAKYVYWHDREGGVRYSMFMAELIAIVRGNAYIIDGTIDGCWTFIKRGQNYGIRLVEGYLG